MSTCPVRTCPLWTSLTVDQSYFAVVLCICLGGGRSVTGAAFDVVESVIGMSSQCHLGY